MNVAVLGMSVWGRGLNSFVGLCDAVAAGGLPRDAEFAAPKAEAIPSRERRRAGLMINLAVAAAHQACEHAGVDKSQLPSVFASSMGDTDITDYMCRKLAQPEKLLSPTKFHNSVHNAPSGYWTISAGNRAPSSFVGGHDYSFGAALLETVSQVMAFEQPVLLVVYDIANLQPFTDVAPIGESFAAGLVLAPATTQTAHAGLAAALSLSLAPAESPAENVPPASALDFEQLPDLLEIAAANPSASSLTLGEALARVQTGLLQQAQLTIMAAPRLCLQVKVTGR